MKRRKHSESKTISALDMYDSKGEIRIPEIQRDLVWTLSQKQLLIDSLLKDYDIPKIYFREIEYKDGCIYDVIDGQQRLNAIFSFIHNKYPMSSDADDYNGFVVKDKYYDDFPTNIQVELMSRSLDIVYLIGYSEEEIDETFLRLQNGTPLKAAEKRRAIAGNMRGVVKELSEHAVFELCEFDNSHYNYEDVAAKILIQIMEDNCVINSKALSHFFEKNPSIKISDSGPKAVKKAFNFLKKAFQNGPSPRFKKYAITDLAVIINSMLPVYNISSFTQECAKAYFDFQDARIINLEKKEEEQDTKLLEYSNAARGDSPSFVEYRQKMLKDYILERIPELELKDPNRGFSQEQRALIYRRGNGVCAKCGKKISENEFHADHIKPHSEGGKTTISNGQLLCVQCNLEKSNKIIHK